MRELLGELVARMLRGAWRTNPPKLEISEDELNTVTPLLLASGAAALGWRRVRNSSLRDTPAARELEQGYLLHTLQAAVHESDIRDWMKLARAAGIEPVLVKGWAVAQFYPEKGLRPYGDIDLCVKPEHFDSAAAIVKSREGAKYNVDLHKGFEKLDGQSVDELFARSQIRRLEDVDVRLLRPEDQLRILCTHLLRHGAWRPLWLCDIAAILESLPADFDWDLCLGPDHHQAAWIACSIGLANQLLGARVVDTPVSRKSEHLPKWLVPAVLKQWRWSRALDHTPPELMIVSLRHLTRLPKALYQRWPNPIQATFNLKAPFNEFPRLPIQVGDCISQVLGFLGRLPKLLRER